MTIDYLIKTVPKFSSIDSLVEKGILPDFILRMGIRSLLNSKLAELHSAGKNGKKDFLKVLNTSKIAVMEDLANIQHYEVPTQFYKYCLGENLKYSCALYEVGDDLSKAEVRMFEKVIERAQLGDGQDILELGCGWGSFCLYLASKFPNSKIVGLSNSKTQKIHIDEVAKQRGLSNLEIRTANVASVELSEVFDRVVSIEMFEHMRNYSELLTKVAGWLKPEGLVFIHIFCHKFYCYPYEVKDDTDWMSKYFFSGGIMPSFDIFEQINSPLKLDTKWKVNGWHYHRTCEDWLKRMDSNSSEIMKLFSESYPKGEAKKWFNYWRVFYLACSELFKFNEGEEWFVGHFLLKKS